MENHLSSEMELETAHDLMELVTFHLGIEEFAVDILNIQGINRMVQVTRVPNAPDYVYGIINLRGQVIPLVDLRRRLGMTPKEHDKNTRFIVVEIHSIVIGFIVDSVNEVLRINRSLAERPPVLSSDSHNSKFILAVAKINNRLITLLDLENVLAHPGKSETE